MDATQEHRIVLVTGPSGAGRTTAINALEDLGYEVIDNLPLSLVERLTEGAALPRPVALGLDVRNRDFNATALIELIDRLTRNPAVALDVIYLDCRPDELIRRYAQTRRRHPLAPAETPAEGIEREIDLLAPIRVRADVLIDTTEMSPHDLKADIARWFGRTETSRLAVSLQSFSYKRGLPRGVDMVFDCRFLSNPHWVPELRDLDGRDPRVAAHVEADPRFAAFFDKLADLVKFLLRHNWKKARRTSPSALAVPEGNTGRLPLQKNWQSALRTKDGRWQNDIANWNAAAQQPLCRRSRSNGQDEHEAMIGIVIVAHGGLAREYLSAVEHVVGKQEGMVAIAIEEDHDRDRKQIEIIAAAKSVDRGDGVLVVTDMFGGSPSNLSLPACVGSDRRILYGANLPMLIKLAKSRDMAVPDAVTAALDAGRKYINSLDLGSGERP